MPITAYKLDPEFLTGKLAELQAQVGAGKALLPIFVEQTRKVLARDGKAYLRYGPYWWSMKRVLRANGVAVGATDEPIWANEFDQASPELTLLAGWEFADDMGGQFGVQTREYDLDGITFLLYDEDQEKGRATA